MIKEIEVNYKLQRVRKDKYIDEYLVICGDYTYYWTDEYDMADLFTSMELLTDVVDKQNVAIDEDNYNYYIVEDIVTNIIPYKNSKNSKIKS